MADCLLCPGGDDRRRGRARACPECGRLHTVCSACAVRWDLAGGAGVPGWDGLALSRCPRSDEFLLASELMGRRS